MAGMNLVFHVAATVVLLLLTARLMVVQRQRDFLRDTMGLSRRLTVADPVSFVKSLAAAAGIPLENEAQNEGVVARRIDPTPWGELLSSTAPTLLRWRGTTLGIKAAPGRPLTPELKARLDQSLGGDPVQIVLL